MGTECLIRARKSVKFKPGKFLLKVFERREALNFTSFLW